MEKEADVPACERFEKEIPSWAKPYVLRLEDVKLDGNCGFRSVALSLGMRQNDWPEIRLMMLEHLKRRPELWIEVFGRSDYDSFVYSVNWRKVEPAGVDHWMWMPYSGFVIAQNFGVIVVFLTNKGSQTFFPLTFGPHRVHNHRIISFAHVWGNHYIMVELAGTHPIPTPHILWRNHRNDEAAEWENIYRPRILEYERIMDSGRRRGMPENVIDLSI